MTPRERAEALARSWWEVSRPLCVWHALYNRPTAVESSRTEEEARSKVADVTAPLADDIARAILADRAEQAAGEAERVREAVARERAAREKAEADAAALRAALGDFAERDCDYGDACPPFGTRHGQCDGCRARKALRATSPAPEPVAADVDAALATIDESLACQFGLTFDGTTIKGCTPNLEDGGTSKTYLDADDCRALAGAFGVVADALAAARQGGGT